MLPLRSSWQLCVPGALSGHVISTSSSVFGSIIAAFAAPRALSAIQTRPSRVTHGVCGTAFGVGTGYVLNCSVAESNRSTALVGLSHPAIQMLPAASTARLCGMERGFGNRYSVKVAFATSGASIERRSCSGVGGSAPGPKYCA